jgi:hypothetical protein
MYKHICKDKTKLSSLGKRQQFILRQANSYLSTFEEVLIGLIDKRLVQTFFDAFVSIILHRNRDKGLLLSELGQYICGSSHAPAGTKRLSNLFRSKNWKSEDIANEQLKRAVSYAQKAIAAGHRVLAFWDDSVIEKHESWYVEGLCPVRSSRANRLTRIKPGYYKKPSSPICVPGYEWSGLLLGGLSLVPMVAKMEWWTSRGKHKECRSNIFYRMFKQVVKEFGQILTHVFDRGYASAATIQKMFEYQQQFILRWNGRNNLKDNKGEIKNTWRIGLGKKSMDKRVVWDKERKQNVKVEIYYEAVKHPDCEAEYPDNQLFLIIIRNKSFKHQPPMYLLSNLDIDTVGMAWETCFSYLKRWDIEQAFRFCKSELGIQSIRLWEWENRKKMMILVLLVYDFILQFFRNWQVIAWACINQWCKRTGKRLALVRLPLYRLRAALSIALLSAWIKNSG